MQEIFRNICIAGSGKMGMDIFFSLFEYNRPLVWLCRDETEKERAATLLRKRVGRMLKAGLTVDVQNDGIPKWVRLTSLCEDVSDTELVIECITEDEKEKRKLFAALDEVAPPGCIFASNSSSILPSRLVPSEQRAPYVAGLHYFYPVRLRQLTELISHSRMSPVTEQKLTAFLVQSGRLLLRQDETNAFVINRILLRLQSRMYRLHTEMGYTYASIDKVAAAHVISGGIFSMMDQIGPEVLSVSVGNYMRQENSMRDEALFLRIKSALDEGEKIFCHGETEREETPCDEEVVLEALLESLKQGIAEARAGGMRDDAGLKDAVADFFDALDTHRLFE